MKCFLFLLPLMACATSQVVIVDQPPASEVQDVSALGPAARSWAAQPQPAELLALFDGTFERLAITVAETGERFTVRHTGARFEFSPGHDLGADFAVTLREQNIANVAAYSSDGTLDDDEAAAMLAVLFEPMALQVLNHPATRDPVLRAADDVEEVLEIHIVNAADEALAVYTFSWSGESWSAQRGEAHRARRVFRLGPRAAVEYLRRAVAALKANSPLGWGRFVWWYGEWRDEHSVAIRPAPARPDEPNVWRTYAGAADDGGTCWLQLRSTDAEGSLLVRTSFFPQQIITLGETDRTDADRRAGIAAVWQDQGIQPLFMTAVRLELDERTQPMSFGAFRNVIRPLGKYRRCEGLKFASDAAAVAAATRVFVEPPDEALAPIKRVVLCARELLQAGRGGQAAAEAGIDDLERVANWLGEINEGAVRAGLPAEIEAASSACQKTLTSTRTEAPSGKAAWFVRVEQALQKKPREAAVQSFVSDVIAVWPSVARAADELRVIECGVVELGINGAALFGARVAGGFASCTTPDGRSYIGVTGNVAAVEGIGGSVDVGAHWVEEEGAAPALAPVVVMSGGLGAAGSWQMEERGKVTGGSFGVGAGFTMGISSERKLLLIPFGTDLRYVLERLAGHRSDRVTTKAALTEDDREVEPLQLAAYSGKVAAAELHCLVRDRAWLVSSSRARCLLAYQPTSDGRWRFGPRPVAMSGVGLGFSVMSADTQSLVAFNFDKPDAALADIEGFYTGRKDYFPLGFENHVARLTQSEDERVSLRLEEVSSDAVGFEHALVGIWVQQDDAVAVTRALVELAVARCTAEPARYNAADCQAIRAALKGG